MKTRETEPDAFEGRSTEGFFMTRIRAGRNPKTGKPQQLRVTIATTDETVARERLARLREVSAALISQGLSAEAKVAIKRAAAQNTDAKFELCCATALSLAPEVRKRATGTWSTLRELGEAWTSGELHRRWPDYIKAKGTSKRDKGRLEYLYELVVDHASNPKRTLGDMPLASLTFQHATEAMSQLPPTCKRPAARRQYAQLIGRVMKLAVFPAGCIAASPLPRNFLPRVPQGDLLFQHFYPDEDLKLMRCEAIDYAVRALFGLCNREGGRLGEFLDLNWSGIDVKRGTITVGIRKNGKPGTWKAEPGSLEALEPLRELGGEGPFSHLLDDGKWAERLQDAMRTAELDREALFYSNVDEGFRRMRGHDTRATYVTLALALGLSESHIMARTGHMTSSMVHKYDHAAKALASEDEHGAHLLPLDEALGLDVPPGPRRRGWVTRPGAEHPRALVAPRGAVPLLPAGDPDPDPSGGPSSSSPAAPAASTPGPVTPAAAASSGPNRARADERSIGSTTAPVPGETEGETVTGFSGESAEPHDTKSSMFSAVAPAGVEPASPLGRGILNAPRACTAGGSTDLTSRNPVAGSDGNAHGVSPETPQVRRPEGVDPVLATLRAAAHEAVDRGDTATVAAFMRAIEQHLASAPTRAPEAGAGTASTARGAA